LIFYANFVEEKRMDQPMNTTSTTTPEAMGILSRIINVFVNPQKTFQAVKVKPAWIVPALIFVVIMGLFGYIQMTNPGLVQAAKDLAMQKMEGKNLTPEQIDAAMAMADKFRAFTPIQNAIMPLLFFLFIGAGIWLFVGNTLLAGKATYGQMLGVTAYTLLVTGLGTLIKLPIVLAKGDLFVHFSLATFMPDSARETFLYKFLMSATDLFNLWTIALLSIGIAVVCDLKTSKVWPMVVAVNLIVFAIFSLFM